MGLLYLTSYSKLLAVRQITENYKNATDQKAEETMGDH
jgi:hypothetical protein